MRPGVFGEHLRALVLMHAVKEDIDVVHTISAAERRGVLCGAPQRFVDLARPTAGPRTAIAAATECSPPTPASIEEGATGIFYAPSRGQPRHLRRRFYAEFGRPYGCKCSTRHLARFNAARLPQPQHARYAARLPRHRVQLGGPR
jgi:hypothetical protein